MASKKTNILRYCPMCGFEIEASNFYTSINPHHNGFSIYCKNCSQKIYLEYYSITKDVAKALWFTCSELGIPFINRIYRSMMDSRQKAIDKYTNEINVENNKKKHNVIEVKKYIDNYKVIGSYVDFLRKTNSQGDDWSTFLATDVDYKDVSSNIEALEVKENEKQKFILDWGTQDEIDDYTYLEYQFYELTDGVEFQNKAQEGLYRDLCLARLSKRKIESGRDIEGDVAKVQKQILDLMKTLKIDNFSEKKEQTLVERMLESRIAIQEKEKPTFYYEGVKKEENVDYLGRGKYFYDHIYRGFHNVLEGSKLYKILPEETDDTKTDEYESIMKQGKVKEEE